jgi:hypothetical protein
MNMAGEAFLAFLGRQLRNTIEARLQGSSDEGSPGPHNDTKSSVIASSYVRVPIGRDSPQLIPIGQPHVLFPSIARSYHWLCHNHVSAALRPLFFILSRHTCRLV